MSFVVIIPARICKLDNLAFPLRDGIPVLLETEARVLTADESKS